MAFLYGLLRVLATGLRWLAGGRHARWQKRYERAETAFQNLETETKAAEVQLGRPMDFAAQLKLLKAYEAKEKARQRWMRSAQRLESVKAKEAWLKELKGRKIPYTLGLVDMATVVYVLDRFSGFADVPLDLVQDVIAMWN